MKKGLFVFLMTWIVGLFTASAQVENPTTWSFSQKDLGNNEYELTFKVAIQPEWHVYSMFTPEGGPMATSITFQEAGKGIELVGKAIENQPKKEHDTTFGVDVLFFEKEYVIKQKIKVTNKELANIQGTIEYQACCEGQCLMLEENFDFKIFYCRIVNLFCVF